MRSPLSLIFVAASLSLATSIAEAGMLSCRDAVTGATILMYGQVQNAAYQMNEALVHQLRTQGLRNVEPSGMGRFGPPDSIAFAAPVRNHFAFKIFYQPGRPARFQLAAYISSSANDVIPPSGRAPDARFNFKTSDCKWN